MVSNEGGVSTAHHHAASAKAKSDDVDVERRVFYLARERSPTGTMKCEVSFVSIPARAVYMAMNAVICRQRPRQCNRVGSSALNSRHQ